MMPNIQILNALAAMMVVFYNSLSATERYSPPIPFIGVLECDWSIWSGPVLCDIRLGDGCFEPLITIAPTEFLLGLLRRIVPT